MKMPQTNHPLSVDLTRIDNAEVRRALRQVMQQVHDTLAQQQVQIEALLELITEKNVASLSEFRRAVQQITARSTERIERIHQELSQFSTPSHPPPAEREKRRHDPDEDEVRQVYRL
jgi:hypothetical protein